MVDFTEYLMKGLPWIQYERIILTLLAIAFFLGLRWVLIWSLRRNEHKLQEKIKRWSINIRNAITVALVYCLLLIWHTPLQDFVFSIAAFFVAIVIAFKELILCIVGGLYQTLSRPFSVGDWIQINGNTGEVADRDWFSTVLLDIDIDNSNFNFTGKTLEVPNSQFLIHTVKKLHFMRRYVVHSFSLHRTPEINLFNLKKTVLEAAAREWNEFQEIATRYQSYIEKQLGVQLPGPEPDVRISTSDIGNSVMTVTLFCPVTEAIAIEQVVTEVFMDEWDKAMKARQL